MEKYYRNEYFYKNTLLNKLLLGVHSLNTTSALTEVPVGKSKADFILINGCATVYEIKTELDNFDRLMGQLEDYYKAFSRVIVVTSESNYSLLQKRLEGLPTGICVLTHRGHLSHRKQPEEFCGDLSSDIMFKILRKSEYEEILLREYSYLPSVSQFSYYRACKSMFGALTTDQQQQNLVKALKKRIQIEVESFKKIPYELKFLVYFSNLREVDYTKLENFLRS